MVSDGIGGWMERMRRTDLLRAEMVERGEEEGRGGVDADDPGEGELVVGDGDQHRQPDGRLQWAFQGFKGRGFAGCGCAIVRCLPCA